MGIFSNRTKLLPDYLPPKLPHREKELERLRKFFSSYLRGESIQRILLLGSVGAGKTALARLFGREMEGKGVSYVHVNCRISRSPYFVLLEAVRKLLPAFPPRGYSVEEMLGTLVSHLEKHGGRLLLTLDELDYQVEVEGPDLLYLLTRYPEQNPAAWRLGLIGICRDRGFLNRLDAPTRSTFQHTLIELDRYPGEQLFDILVFRAGEAIQPGKVDEEVLRLISDMASGTGDARFALEVLYRAGCLAEQRMAPRILPEHVREAKASIYPELKRHVLAELRPHEATALLALARRLRSTRAAYASSSEVYGAYQVVCEEYGEKPLSYNRFSECLERLGAMGLLRSKQERRQGLLTLLSIEEAPVEVLIPELEKLIESRRGRQIEGGGQ